MPDGKSFNIKTALSIVQWIISVLAIPALVWAWNLSTQVKLQQQEITSLQQSASKSDEYAVELAKMNTTLDYLKESLSEIKEILRD